MRLRTFRTWVVRPTLIGLAAMAALVGWRLGFSENFAEIEPGEIYRSAQLPAASLAARLHEHQVRTVLNLRGSHPESAWYRAERAATLEAGATQIDIPLSSCEWMSRAQALALVDVLESADRPLLIHCFHGSERTGLAVAFAELLRSGSTLDDARAQFSIKYHYLGLGDGVVTYRHLERYASWLRDAGLTHTPDQFRRWIAEGYRPGEPSREHWNFDPYPLVVVTKGVAKVAQSARSR